VGLAALNERREVVEGGDHLPLLGYKKKAQAKQRAFVAPE
jgi:hypothetical protein